MLSKESYLETYSRPIFVQDNEVILFRFYIKRTIFIPCLCVIVIDVISE